MPVIRGSTTVDEVSMTDRNREQQGDIPTGSDELPGDRAEIDRATVKKVIKPEELDSIKKVVKPEELDTGDAPNPPRTTTGKFTAPKFGSAGSGGAELEPGPERD
jgi:hypothetical protein